MKIMIMPTSLNMLKKCIGKYNSVMVGIKDLSINMPKYFSYEEFLDIYNSCIENNIEVFVALN